MTTTTFHAPAATRPVSAVPYLAGLDGMRALAVVAVMVYHADPSWLSGGFLGVEVFFVISGYLITLLMIGEHERHGHVSLRDFWSRRARRLLPALAVLLVGVTIYTALFRRDALGQLRGDVIAATTYVSNWYQIWVGQGYTASGDFAPLRHLWSLAVEEQFYLFWPVVMIALLRVGRRRLPAVSLALVGAAVAITAIVAALYHEGPIGTPAVTPDAYWTIGDRAISKMDFLYLSTPTRATGLLLGAAFAMVWRPAALMRGPMRRRAPALDAVAVVGLVTLGGLCWYLHVVTPAGADPWLFRGGFLLTGLATLAVIAAVTHQRSATGRMLGNPLFVWIGTRSYGLYLYHWPIFQGIRRIAGNTLTVTEFAAAMAATAVVAELSYRFVETPVRRRTVRGVWRRLQRTASDVGRRALAVTAAFVIVIVGVAGASMATAELQPNEIAAAQADAAAAVGDPFAPSARPAAARPASRPSTTTTSSTTDPPTTVAPVTTPPTTVPAAVVASTAPPTAAPTTPPTPPATEPPPPPVAPMPVGDPCVTTPIPRYALGDSVMLGAAGPLASAGFCVDAVVSRAFVNGLDQVIRLRAEGRLGPLVVVALGTNGPIGGNDLGRLMGELSGVPQVVVVTTRADRNYVPSNNEQLRALPAAYPNVQVVDWADASAACPGDCFYADGIHLKPDGRTFYTAQITALTG